MGKETRKLMGILLFLGIGDCVWGNDPVPTSDAERGGVLKLLDGNDSHKHLSATEAKSLPRSALIYIKKYFLPGQGEDIRFVTLHYNYETGRTFQTVVDLKNKRVLQVEDLGEDYPTPLGGEEYLRAQKLAREKVPEVAALYRSQAKVTVQPLMPHIVNPKHPLYRQRAVQLFFNVAGEPPIQVEVRLRDGTAKRVEGRKKK